MAAVHSATVPSAPILNVHCKLTIAFIKNNCEFTEPLDIHEPIVINVADADQWKSSGYLRIPYASNITVFPSGIFQQFPELQQLEMSNVGLKSIEKHDFKDADMLSYLDIHGNEVQTLYANVFVYAKELRVIDLSDNQLSRIADYAFDGLNRLNVMHLKNNSLTDLRRNTFADAPNIKHLHLEDNRIEWIEDGVFDLPKLKKLFLLKNRIQSLSDNVFRHSPKLMNIDLCENDLNHIGKAFHDCNKLEMLILDNNTIDDISLIAFAKLPKLTYLKLRNSGFRWTEMERRYDGRNGEQWPETPSSLKYLDISNNSLTGSDPLIRLRHFSNLEELYVRDNNLNDLNGIQGIRMDFPKLKAVGVSGNQFVCDKLQLIVENIRAQGVRVPEAVGDSGFGYLRRDINPKQYQGMTCF